MSNVHQDNSGDTSDSDDVLSFANLPIPGYKHSDVSGRVSSSSDQDRFEFLNSFGSDPVRNDPPSLWERTGSRSHNETRLGFKSGSHRKAFDHGLKSGSVRKNMTRSIRIVGSDHTSNQSIESQHEQAQVSPMERNGDKREKPMSRGSHLANVLAKFGCLSA